MEYVKLILMAIAMIELSVAFWHGWNGRDEKKMQHHVSAMVVIATLIFGEVSA